MTDEPTTSGVQDLIDRLGHEGVSEGERQAESIVADARKKADEILDAARSQAAKIVEEARREADQYREAGEEAMRLAGRDAVRDLASKIHEGFRDLLQRLVHNHLEDQEFVKSLILQIAERAVPEDEQAPLEILLPPEVVQEEEIRKRLEAGEPDVLTEFVQGLTGEGIREGFSIRLSEEDQTGLVVRVANEDVEIDLTDEAITDLLAVHLLPRFRAVMRSG